MERKVKVFYLAPDGKTTEMSQLCSSIKWSGDMQQAARRLELEIADSAYDNNVPRVDINPGSVIKLVTDEGNEIFFGYAFMRERNFSSQTTSILCYDGMVYLTKSSASYNFRNMSAEQITRKICADFGIKQGTLAGTGIKQSRIVISKSPYEIITEVYANAGKQNGKKYVALMKEGKLNIVEKGEKKVSCILDPGVNICSSRYSESIENMVNRVKIYDDKGNCISKMENSDWIRKYGILQGSYGKESGKDPSVVAGNMLKDIERKGDIEAVGDVRCTAGNAIEIKECYSGIKGLFYINSDSHAWQGGKHTMQLTLDFEKVV